MPLRVLPSSQHLTGGTGIPPDIPILAGKSPRESQSGGEHVGAAQLPHSSAHRCSRPCFGWMRVPKICPNLQVFPGFVGFSWICRFPAPPQAQPRCPTASAGKVGEGSTWGRAHPPGFVPGSRSAWPVFPGELDPSRALPELLLPAAVAAPPVLVSLGWTVNTAQRSGWIPRGICPPSRSHPATSAQGLHNPGGKFFKRGREAEGFGLRGQFLWI